MFQVGHTAKLTLNLRIFCSFAALITCLFKILCVGLWFHNLEMYKKGQKRPYRNWNIPSFVLFWRNFVVLLGGQRPVALAGLIMVSPLYYKEWRRTKFLIHEVNTVHMARADQADPSFWCIFSWIKDKKVNCSFCEDTYGTQSQDCTTSQPDIQDIREYSITELAWNLL